MKGVERHCSKKHLYRYMAESDFRCSDCVSVGLDDRARNDVAVTSVVTKHLAYAQ